MKNIRYLLALLMVLGGGYFIAKEQGFLTSAPATTSYQTKILPSPSSINLTNAPACEPIQYSITRIFAYKAYQDLTPCLAESVRFSRFESSDSRNLSPQEIVQEITKLSQGVNSWITNPDDAAVKKLRELHINAWSEAIIVLADNKTGFVFTLDKDKRIWTVVFITNYPAISQP